MRRFSRWTRLAAAATAALALGAARAGAAVIDSASAAQRGAIVELHFDVRGKGFAWTLSAHGDEL
ncbi:MAG TPA: hypothetical protein VNF49_10820, partial [Candidatus Binataceae bacterium]|nr:hypothetical protein [Candidatus Binataceae bacterium]